MSKTKKVVIVFSCIFLASLIGIGVTLGAFFAGGKGFNDFADLFGGEQFKVHESSDLDLEGVKAVRIDCASADIHIVESGNTKAVLEGVVVSPGREQQYLSVEKKDDTIYIIIEHDRFFFSIFTGFDLTVYLPGTGLDADIRCSSGDIDAEGFSFGDLKITRTSGDLKLKDCAARTLDSGASSGDTEITSCTFESASLVCQSGDTSIIDTAGALRAHSTSGDIDIEGADGAIDVECTSGEVSIDLANSKLEPVTVGVTSGDVRIYVPWDAAFNLSAKTISGDIKSDLDISVSGSSLQSFIGEEISGKCNGGGAQMTLNVTSGGIHIIGK